MAETSTTGLITNQFVCQTLTSTNNVVNSILKEAEKALCVALPMSENVIQEVLQKYKDPFKCSASIFNDTSTAQTRLPIRIKTRRGAKEKQEGVFATNVRGNIGSKNLEKACKSQNLVPDQMMLVEVRRFERDLDEYCTVPPCDLPFIEIQQGVKYELVFEDIYEQKFEQKPQIPHGTNGLINIPIHTSSPHPEIIQLNSNSRPRSAELNQSVVNTPYNTGASISTPKDGQFTPNRTTPKNTSHIGSVSKSAAAIRELEALKELPQFDILDVIRNDPKGKMVLDALMTEGIKRTGRQRVFFVQILGKYFSEVLKPQLCVANAATRRAFIDECFSQLSAVSNFLPNVEDYSNRMGNGFLDIYLKHQVTRERKKAQQKLNEKQDIIGMDFEKIGLQNGSDLATLLMNLPHESPKYEEEIHIDPHSEEAAQLRKFNFNGPSIMDEEEVDFKMEESF
ncbi:unnamed protein product [Bursaphelenchus okinawaensis]|uniref:Uncharacterized protein n=1 Tax=Bursaphelenchus okinawaensis TaxID=465554 RepID=A0A811L7V9_9BILA|nr:unnamed protein product [Bursaphelenchus okinawaensis]CAG9117383.1 unnamed protein product [Bursaphelenchus okinawaensis]